MEGNLLEIIDIAHAQSGSSRYILISFKTNSKPTTVQTLKISKSFDNHWHMISKFIHRSGAKSYYDFSVLKDRENLIYTVKNSGYDQILLDEYLQTTKEIFENPKVRSALK